MRLPYPAKLKPGDELTTGWLNHLLWWVKRNTIQIGANAGLTMIQNENGITLGATDTGGRKGQVAYTISSISARAGTVPGSGMTYSVVFNGTNLVTQDGTGGSQLIIYATYNFAATSVAGNKYCWVQQDPSGSWFIVSVEC